MTNTVHTVAELRAVLDSRRAGRTVALVPTMGALHDGHLALVDAAREHADIVVVSIFVNPTQFGPTEDFERYPRTLDADVSMLSAAGVDVVFAPTAAEVYPASSSVTPIEAGPLGDNWEGADRLGHFDAVATVVGRLFDIVQPDFAVFGEKDWQQLAVIRHTTAGRATPVRIEAVPTVREADGLARSSRNRMLTESERATAAAIPKAFRAISRRGASPEVVAAARVHLEHSGVTVRYLETVDPETLVVTHEPGPARLLFAGTVGATRLLDNWAVDIPDER
ncbi:MAG: hypothetical protein RIS25_1240 [Actinomycetota bacterium]|jgi:pantoate--beta-alanine ligase